MPMHTLIVMAAVSVQGVGVSGDTCAEPIAVVEGTTLFDTTNHTDSEYSLYSKCSLMGGLYKDIWFSYQAQTEGVVTLSTCQQGSFDTSVIVYQATGAGCDGLEYLACSGDAAGDPDCQPYHSVVEFEAQSDGNYMIRIGGWVEGSFGTGMLSLSNSDQDIPQYCLADINSDGDVGFNDLLLLLGAWGTCPDCPEDLDESGDVGFNDLLEVLGAWGPCPLQGSWQVMINSPVAPMLHHDSIAVIGDNIWICNISGEIWKSTDAGESWLLVADQPATSFRTISFADELHGFVGNLGPGSWVGHTTDTNPLYITDDGGLTWSPVPLSSINGPIPDGICGIQAVDANTIYGAGRYAGGAYFVSSTDGGATWSSLDLNDSYWAFVDIFFETPERGYITGTNLEGRASLVYTEDRGESWVTKKTNVSGHYWKMGFASDTFGYAVCSGGQDTDKWIQTYDGGETWTERSFTDGFHANGIGFLNDQVGWIGGYPSHTLQTWNGGETWEPIQIDLVYGDVINKFLKVSETEMYAVGNRVYKYSSAPLGYQRQAGGRSFDNDRCTLTATTKGTSTTITYKVPEDGHVVMNVFIFGSLIYDRPVDEFQLAGTYSCEFDTPEDAPELYVSIQTGDYRQWTKFVPKPE